jgi:hypothetical protein
MKCPKCGTLLNEVTKAGVLIDVCDSCLGSGSSGESWRRSRLGSGGSSRTCVRTVLVGSNSTRTEACVGTRPNPATEERATHPKPRILRRVNPVPAHHSSQTLAHQGISPELSLCPNCA